MTRCDCGHPLDDHQSGAGPWSGFCGGTLGTLEDAALYLADGASPDEPCACEAPTRDNLPIAAEDDR